MKYEYAVERAPSVRASREHRDIGDAFEVVEVESVCETERERERGVREVGVKGLNLKREWEKVAGGSSCQGGGSGHLPAITAAPRTASGKANLLSTYWPNYLLLPQIYFAY